MKRILGILLVLSIWASFPLRAQWAYQFKGVEYNWLVRDSSMLTNTYVQLASQVSFHPVWLNLTPGLEIDFTDEALTRYFLEERITLPGESKNSVVVRLNHLEYKDWEVGVNALNLYFEQERKKLEWALGLAYLSNNLEDYNDPFKFEEELYQLRVLYSVGYVHRFWKERSVLRIGAEDFTQFENYGYDQLGPFIELGYQATERLYLKGKVDLRLVGIGTATPHLERSTYLLGLEWKNLPKKSQDQD